MSGPLGALRAKSFVTGLLVVRVTVDLKDFGDPVRMGMAIKHAGNLWLAWLAVYAD